MSMPSSVPSLLGDVALLQGPQVDKMLRREGSLGDFNWADRTIRLRSDMPMEMQVKTLGHEIAHSILYDTGLHNLLTNKMEEAICDAVGTWLLHATQSGKLYLR